jgi:hypothetical protein
LLKDCSRDRNEKPVWRYRAPEAEDRDGFDLTSLPMASFSQYGQVLKNI